MEKKHREKGRNTGKTQGKHREFYLGWNVATLMLPEVAAKNKTILFYFIIVQMKLSQDAEEVATFYGRMLDHDYTTMEAFNKNFMKDWRKVGCSPIHSWHKSPQISRFLFVECSVILFAPDREFYSRYQGLFRSQWGINSQPIYGIRYYRVF